MDFDLHKRNHEFILFYTANPNQGEGCACVRVCACARVCVVWGVGGVFTQVTVGGVIPNNVRFCFGGIVV